MTDDNKPKRPKAWYDLQRQMTKHKGALYAESLVIKITAKDGSVISTEVSAPALAAIAVAPDYTAALTALNAEVGGLSTSVLQTLIDKSLSWEKSGMTIAESIAQLKDAGDEEIDIQALVRSFAVAEKDKRSKRRDLWLAVLGSGAVTAFFFWLLTT